MKKWYLACLLTPPLLAALPPFLPDATHHVIVVPQADLALRFQSQNMLIFHRRAEASFVTDQAALKVLRIYDDFSRIETTGRPRDLDVECYAAGKFPEPCFRKEFLAQYKVRPIKLDTASFLGLNRDTAARVRWSRAYGSPEITVVLMSTDQHRYVFAYKGGGADQLVHGTPAQGLGLETRLASLVQARADVDVDVESRGNLRW